METDMLCDKMNTAPENSAATAAALTQAAAAAAARRAGRLRCEGPVLSPLPVLRWIAAAPINKGPCLPPKARGLPDSSSAGQLCCFLLASFCRLHTCDRCHCTSILRTWTQQRSYAMCGEVSQKWRADCELDWLRQECCLRV